jgi:hypothetical protein
MADGDLQSMVDGLWGRVRRKHLFPELPRPTLRENPDGAALDIRRKQIHLAPAFLRDPSLRMAPAEVAEALCDHAVSHHLYCPWDVFHYLQIVQGAREVLEEKRAARWVAHAFMDVVAGTRCVSRVETPLPRLYRRMERTGLAAAVGALCRHLWRGDPAPGEWEGLVRKLAFIPYLDRSRWPESVRRFARILQPFLAEGGSGGCAEAPDPMGEHGLGQFSSGEIRSGLKELARRVGDPRAFHSLASDFEAEIGPALELPGHGAGLGSGTPVDTDALFYMKLAENYWLPVRSAPLKKSGALYPHHHVPWEIGQTCRDIDPWTSLGKIMPGITQIWKREQGEVFGRREQVPDCIVAIDSSSSMVHPSHRLSYAVLGAGCACDAYLRNGARVAVLNFSDAAAGGRLVRRYSSGRTEIYRSLCRYLGGGTRMDTDDIEGLQVKPAPDIFLITDMQIANLETVAAYFADCPNRITTVHLGDNVHVEAFRSKMMPRPHHSLFRVRSRQDIPRIVLGQVRSYMEPL